MNKRADWLGWMLQGIVGLAVGAGVGIYLLRRSNVFWTESISIVHFLAGTALIGAALSSYLGDRLWLNSAYLLLQPDAPRHNRASRAASLLVGLIGGILMVTSFPAARLF